MEDADNGNKSAAAARCTRNLDYRNKNAVFLKICRPASKLQRTMRNCIVRATTGRVRKHAAAASQEADRLS